MTERHGITEEIAARDAYRRSTDGSVVEVLEDGVVLDRTVFYPRGGGQPGDTGWLRWEGRAARVVDTIRRDAKVVHLLDRVATAPARGTEVLAEIDWDRRHLLMRTHTALHVLSGVIWRDYGAKVTGGNMDPGEARMDFELEAMPPGFGAEVEGKLNLALAEAHPVEVTFLPRAEALADPDLIRTKVNLIPDTVDPIRVVDIVGIDRQADGGTHVASTVEVGRVRVVRTDNKGRNFKRMRIAVGPS
jgi:misacylated tRNA(Ala) deacylase